MSRACSAQCRAQPGSELIPPRHDGDASLEGTLAGCNDFLMVSDSSAVSTEDADAQELQPTFQWDAPGIGYAVHSHSDYRPCDVANSNAPVCEILAGGRRTESAAQCAQLCACLRDRVGADCNAATWVWRESQGSNCFPKFIEGLDARSGDLPRQACAYSSSDGDGEAHTLLVQFGESAQCATPPCVCTLLQLALSLAFGCVCCSPGIQKQQLKCLDSPNSHACTMAVSCLLCC